MSYRYRTNYDPYPYPIGKLVRYESGPTALMEICSLHEGAHGYHGRQCMGGLTFAGHDQCEPASDADYKVWHENQRWRRP